MNLLKRILRPLLKKITLGFFMKTMGAMAVLLLPYMLATLIDEIVPLQRLDLVLKYGAAMIVISFVGLFFDIFANRIAAMVAKDATLRIRHDLFEKTIGLSCRKTDEFTVPSLESRLTSDTYNVHRMLGMVQRMGVRAPILLLGGIAITIMMEPVLSMVVIGMLPFIMLVIYFRAIKGIRMFKFVQKAQDKMIAVVRENAQGIRIIKALSKEDHEKKRYEKVNEALADEDYKANRRMASIYPLITVVLNAGLVLVILVGAWRVNNGLSETGKIIAFMNYFTIVTNALIAVSRIFVMSSKGLASADRIEEVLQAQDELVMIEDEGVDSEYEIEFDHVNFSYLGVKNNIQDLSFRLKSGQTLGIIGATGSGKTTVLQLLLRFYDADSGSIRLRGKDIRSVDPKKIRKEYGVVMQNDFIFKDTVRENILFGREVDSDDLVEATKTAQAYPFIRNLEEAFDHPLNSKGTNLSGGQRQRIFLSRAFASHPKILLLDDSSSALDYETDARLRSAISQNYQDTTKIIVAQRVSSILHADEILVMDQGKVIARGTHEQLLKSSELYASISESQMGGALLE